MDVEPSIPRGVKTKTAEVLVGGKYAQAVGEKQAATWKQYAWVAAKVEISLRNEILSFQHHYAVAPLSPAEQRSNYVRAYML